MSARSLLLCAALALVACRRPPPDDAPRPVPSTESTTSEPSRAQLESTLCAARAPCALVEVKSASAGLWIVKITTDPGGHADAASPSPERCVPYEHWLVRAKGSSIVDRRELLRTCNDGYGAAGVGEDVVTIEPGLFTHVQRGGSAWRWEHGRTLELDPLRMKGITWWSGSTISPVSERGAFDWSSFRGRARWYRPPCPAGGGPPPTPDADELDIVSRPNDPRAYVYDPLPVVELPESFRSGGFASTPLGTCAPPIDGVGERGFVVSGAPGDDADARLRIVAARTGDPKTTELYVEVADDVSIGPSAKWALDDHLQVWLQEDDPDPSELCLPTSAGAGAGALTEWIVRLVDGKTFPGLHAGGSTPIVVSRATGKSVDGRAVTRLKLVLTAPSLQAITLAFSDSDDGKTIERVIAHSRLSPGKAATLGRLWPVDPKEAICTSASGALDRRLTQAFPANAPVLGE